MRFLAAIYADEGTWGALSEEERAAEYAAHTRFWEEASAAGVVVDGAELRPTSAATTVRVRDGGPEVTDGPYAETRETLGGFYVLECASMDEAVEWASRIPTAAHGAIEVRAVHVDEEPGGEAVSAGEEVAA